MVTQVGCFETRNSELSGEALSIRLAARDHFASSCLCGGASRDALQKQAIKRVQGETSEGGYLNLLIMAGQFP